MSTDPSWPTTPCLCILTASASWLCERDIPVLAAPDANESKIAKLGCRYVDNAQFTRDQARCFVIAVVFSSVGRPRDGSRQVVLPTTSGGGAGCCCHAFHPAFADTPPPSAVMDERALGLPPGFTCRAALVRAAITCTVRLARPLRPTMKFCNVVQGVLLSSSQAAQAGRAVPQANDTVGDCIRRLAIDLASVHIGAQSNTHGLLYSGYCRPLDLLHRAI